MRLIFLAAVLATSLGLAACDQRGSASERAQIERGAQLIAANGCGACHEIPGIEGADGRVGPPLEHIATRIFIAGVLRNSPDNLARWIREPQKVAPGNAMPDMGLSRPQSQAIAAYLETLN